MDTEIIIIGSGMAGLACARRLAAAGVDPLVLDKGRGIGGRMATRRVALGGGNGSFDHGAQYLTARDPAFVALIASLGNAVACWQDGADEPHHVGLPGNSGLPRALAAGLDVRQGIEIAAIHADAGVWHLAAGSESFRARRLVLTMAAPQVANLLGPNHPLTPRLAPVKIAPCLTLMAAFPADAPRPFVSRLAAPDGPLAWVALDSSKPGRGDAFACWVAQAGPEWSQAHIGQSPAAIAARMLPLLAETIGAPAASALHAEVHRWRYARVTHPLGQPFLRAEDGRLWLGGDWCLGPRIEAAWLSGEAIAAAILAEMSPPR